MVSWLPCAPGDPEEGQGSPSPPHNHHKVLGCL